MNRIIPVLLISFLSFFSGCKSKTGMAESVMTIADDNKLVNLVSCKLTDPSKPLFAKERQAYRAWRSWQDTICLELMGDLWELWHGGSALGSWQEAYLNEVEQRNEDDLQQLQQILSGEKPNGNVHEPASIERIQAETRAIIAEVENRFAAWREAGTGKIVVPDYYDFGLEIKPRMKKIMDKDMTLLREWTDARNQFSQSLSPNQRVLYNNLTNEQLHRILWQYQTRFIRD